MTQEIINVGTAPNDGLGDPIRTAFQKTNNNFTQLFSAQAPNTIINGTSNVSINTANGNIALSVANISNIVVVTTNSVNVNGNLSVTGNITYTNIETLRVTDPLIELAANNTSDLLDIGFYAPVNPGVQQNTGLARDHTTGVWKFFSNVVATPTTTIDWANAVYDPVVTGPLTSETISANSVSIVGNISANYIIGNGSQLTGLPASYGDSNVASYLPTYTGNLVALTGNITTTANVSGNYILGDGSQLTNLPAGNYSNANVADYLPTYTGNLVALTGNITTTANVTGNYILGDGSQLTNLPTGNYSNSNVASYLPTYSGNIADLMVTGNLTATTQGNSDSSNLVATTQFVQNIVTTSGGYGNAQVAAYLPTYTGNLVALTGEVTTTANVSGNYILGNGATLSNITGANVVGAVANATLATSATTASTVTGNVQANITSVGTLTSLTVSTTNSNISTPGNTIVSNGFFKLPRYTTDEITNLSGMTGGELVFNTDLGLIQGYQTAPSTVTGWVSWTTAVYQ